MNSARSTECLDISQHFYKTPSGLIRQTEIVHARWESGKLILEQWTVKQTYKAEIQQKELTYVA
jgi:hypothetical protein